VLPTLGHPAVLELEDEATVNSQVLAVSLRVVVVNADHAAVIICKQVLQLGLEGPSRLLPQPFGAPESLGWRRNGGADGGAVSPLPTRL
jgi:hypothetical protein